MQTEQGWHATDCQPIVSRRSIRVRQIHKRVKTLRILVGATGFEPATPCAQGRCATRLRYAPTQNPWYFSAVVNGFAFPVPKLSQNVRCRRIPTAETSGFLRDSNCVRGQCRREVAEDLPEKQVCYMAAARSRRFHAVLASIESAHTRLLRVLSKRCRCAMPLTLRLPRCRPRPAVISISRRPASPASSRQPSLRRCPSPASRDLRVPIWRPAFCRSHCPAAPHPSPAA